MTGLTRTDLSVIEGDARVSCYRLAEVLGYARIDTLVRVIRSRLEELEDFGEVFHLKVEKAGPGRPKSVYYLNEHQASAICMWAETKKAREARRQIIEVFVAWRRGDLHGLAAQAQQPDVFEASAQRAETSVRQMRSLAEADEFLREVAHLPIWPSKRRPSWWRHIELREFLTVAHRQMSTIEAARQGRMHFGALCPGKSAICEYWLRLDEAKTGVTRIRRRRSPRALTLVNTGAVT